jgi:glutaminyl-peptide cyclotransferase
MARGVGHPFDSATVPQRDHRGDRLTAPPLCDRARRSHRWASVWSDASGACMLWGISARVTGVLVLCLIGAASCGGAGRSAPERPASGADRFDARAAWRTIELQLRYGQRPAGSPQLRRLARRLRARLPRGRFEPVPGDRRLRNIVGTIPGRRPAVVIGAHYDTLAAPEGFVGANNGAAGTAITVQLARDIGKLRRPRDAPELRFVLFDGEEPPEGLPEEATDFYSTGLRGSRAYVERHAATTRAMVLLDYVANRGLRLPREASSSLGLWGEIRAAARATGHAAVFPDETQQAIIDDHTPFLRAGIPAVDLIDWSYDGHSIQDTLDKLSTRSVDAVGETLVQLVRRLDRAS